MKEAPIKVMIAGGGVAALEGMMALHELAGERISMQLVTPTPEFAYRPLAVAEPFGLGEARRYDVVRMAADHRAAVHIAGIKSVDTARHRVVTWDGRELPFDVLLVAVGARATTSIPGSVMVQGPGLHRPLPHPAPRPRGAAVSTTRRVRGAARELPGPYPCTSSH